MIKAVSPARSIGPHIFAIHVFSIRKAIPLALFTIPVALNNPWNLGNSAALGAPDADMGKSSSLG